MILVSACLTGQSTRYDGGHSLDQGLMTSLAGLPYVALCPEVLGGLAVPRPPARMVGAEPGREGASVLAGRAQLVNRDGVDVTQAYLTGARLVLAVAKSLGVTRAYLKDRSPACAWDPKGANPKGGPGMGVLAALLSRHGIETVEVRVSK